VGVPWEERHADWYAYFELDGQAGETEIRTAIARRRRNAEAGANEPWAVRMRAELDRIESILCDPTRRKAYDDELARVRALREAPKPRQSGHQGPAARVDPAINWYAILGIHERASDAEIRRALEAKGRELASSARSAAAYGRERALLIEASRILTHPATRAAYDAARARAAAG
jgi:DnaJ-class molecular chaperone